MTKPSSREFLAWAEERGIPLISQPEPAEREELAGYGPPEDDYLWMPWYREWLAKQHRHAGWAYQHHITWPAARAIALQLTHSETLSEAVVHVVVWGAIIALIVHLQVQ